MFCTSEILKGNGLGYKLEYKDGVSEKGGKEKPDNGQLASGYPVSASSDLTTMYLGNLF